MPRGWSTARRMPQALRRARLRLWAAREDLRLRRHGSRLRLRIEGDVRWHALPAIEVTRQGLSRPPRSSRRMVDIRLGAGVHLGRGLVLEVRPAGENRLSVGDHVTFTAHARVTLFDGAVHVGDETQVRPFSLLKSSGDLRIGARALVSHQVIVHCAEAVELGDGVCLADRVSVIDSEHAGDGGDGGNPGHRPALSDPVVIGSRTFVGANSIVLRGARLGAGCRVAAGSVVVAGEYPAGELLVGSPARPVKPVVSGRPPG